MVLIKALVEPKSKNFSNKQDLPTPESPTITNLKLYSSLVVDLEVRVLLLRLCNPEAPEAVAEAPLKLIFVGDTD